MCSRKLWSRIQSALKNTDFNHQRARALLLRRIYFFSIDYVIMPDHIHLFIRCPRSHKLGTWVHGLKRVIGQCMEKDRSSGRRTWQPGFFDHLLRSGESYEEQWNYVRENPVRAELVTMSKDWPYQGEIVRIDRVQRRQSLGAGRKRTRKGLRALHLPKNTLGFTMHFSNKTKPFPGVPRRLNQVFQT